MVVITGNNSQVHTYRLPFYYKKYSLLLIYIMAALIASIQLYSLGKSTFRSPVNKLYTTDIMSQPAIRAQFEGKQYTQYNNYVIFKQSYFHLLKGENLYTFYPNEQWDLYKYSPSFPVLMMPFAYLPDVAGLALWNLLNALILFAAIQLMPFTDKNKGILSWFVLIEMLTSLQNAQSNALLAGLIIMSYGFIYKKKGTLAALMLVIATIIKPYAIVGFALFLFYPPYLLKALFYSLLWAVIILLLPLLFTSPALLAMQYKNWFSLMAADQSASYGLSVMGWLHTWFGLSNINNYIMLAGVFLFLLPLIRIQLYNKERYQLLWLASALIWVIIFNYKAESPTFIIALAGAGIWYVAGPKNGWRTAFIILVLVGTSLTSTDLFPHFLHQQVFAPYVIKVVPCILLWVVLFIELITMLPKNAPKRDTSNIQNIPNQLYIYK